MQKTIVADCAWAAKNSCDCILHSTETSWPFHLFSLSECDPVVSEVGDQSLVATISRLGQAWQQRSISASDDAGILSGALFTFLYGFRFFPRHVGVITNTNDIADFLEPLSRHISRPIAFRMAGNDLPIEQVFCLSRLDDVRPLPQ